MNTLDYNKRLMDILYHPIDENDMNVQEEYFNHLNHLMEAIAYIRLKEYKKTFLTIDELDEFLHKSYDRVFETKDESYLPKIINELLYVLNQDFEINLTYEELEKDIMYMYHKYSYTGNFPKDLIANLYTKLLNAMSDGFIKFMRNEMKYNICNALPITNKKVNLITKSYRLKVIEEYFQKREYKKLNTTEKEIIAKAQKLRDQLKNSKELKKKKINFTDEQFEYLEMRFAQGRLEVEDIQKLLDCPLKSAKIIVNEYRNIWLDYLNEIRLNKIEVNKLLDKRRHSLGFDYNNFVIVQNRDSMYYAENLIKLMPEYLKRKILLNAHLYEEIAFLMPFIEYFKELTIDHYIKILEHYPTIKEVILEKKKERKEKTYISDAEWLEYHLEDLITLSLGYAPDNEIEYSLLGKEVWEKIKLRATKYAEIYMKMLEKRSSYIPNIKGEFAGFHFECGAYQDPKRLLIGRNCENSCIDLFKYGEPTFVKVLTEKDADVVMIYDKENKFYGRLLVFRRGNFLLMGPLRMTIQNTLKTEFDQSLIQYIGEKFIEKGTKVNDNLDFVLMAEQPFYHNNQKIPQPFYTIKNDHFKTDFPHADLSEKVMIIAKKEERGYIFFDRKPEYEYKNTREKITENPSPQQISKLRAIKKMQNINIENIDKTMEFFDPRDYEKIIAGEDWYLAIKHNGELEECLIPNYDKQSVTEFVNAKMRILDELATRNETSFML